MKRILIIYPHWPPSNLVGVHRVRLIANELHHLGWQATVLTVDERDYEEPGDPDSLKLVAPEVEVVKVRAKPVRKILGKRFIGDIGLRAFGALKSEALKLCNKQKFDFAWISMPSWYPALIGRHLHKQGTPFGIDYQDPWVYDLPEQVLPLSRAAMTIRVAKILEPIAVKQASIITGINQPYYQGVLDRNPQLKFASHSFFQLGFSHLDHNIPMPQLKTPWGAEERTFIYAGAFLPKSLVLWERLFTSLAALKSNGKLDSSIRFYLFGTGQTQHLSLQTMADQAGIGDVIVEHPDRIPFLHVQEFLRRAEGVLSIGSTEIHYSASKTFQCLLSGNKLFSYFHEGSEAREILGNCEADSFHVSFHPKHEVAEEIAQLKSQLQRIFEVNSTEWSPELRPLENYNSRKSAETLVNTIEKALNAP